MKDRKVYGKLEVIDYKHC